MASALAKTWLVLKYVFAGGLLLFSAAMVVGWYLTNYTDLGNPERSAYQELSALRDFYKTKEPVVERCLYYTALVLEAYDLAEPVPEVAAARLYEKYKDRLGPGEQQGRFIVISSAVSGIASGLRPLSKESAQIAYMQMCRFQAASNPNVGDPAALNKSLQMAESCEKNATGDERRSCVARAFMPPPK